MQQGHTKQAASLPFHITNRHRKFKMFYQHLNQPNLHSSLENVITPITKAKKKLPISGQVARKIRQNKQKKHILQTQHTKRSNHQPYQLLKNNEEEEVRCDNNNQNVPNYLRLKQIKRKNSVQSNGSAYVKQTDEQLQQRVKQFVRLIQSKRLRTKRRNLLEKGEYERRLIDSEIHQCQKTIIQNQRMMERQARIQQRLKCLKRGRVMVDKYILSPQHNQSIIFNSLDLRSQLSDIDQKKNILKMNRQSMNVSQLERGKENAYHRHTLSEPEQQIVVDYFQNENQQMLKKLITLVKKKERLNYLAQSSSTPRIYQ